MKRSRFTPEQILPARPLPSWRRHHSRCLLSKAKRIRGKRLHSARLSVAQDFLQVEPQAVVSRYRIAEVKTRKGR